MKRRWISNKKHYVFYDELPKQVLKPTPEMIAELRNYQRSKTSDVMPEIDRQTDDRLDDLSRWKRNG